jgi:uncharacterized protein (DUF2141 family)
MYFFKKLIFKNVVKYLIKSQFSLSNYKLTFNNLRFQKSTILLAIYQKTKTLPTNLPNTLIFSSIL